jgi:hypothetical protein
MVDQYGDHGDSAQAVNVMAVRCFVCGGGF